MRINLNFTNNQAALFSDILTTTLQALVFEEAMCMDALENRNLEADEKTEEGFNRINQHLAMIQPQRVILAEVLGTIKEALDGPKIITDLNDAGIIPPGMKF